MTNEQITSILEDTAASIKKLQVNLKKCPKTRLTKGYLEARLNALEEYWCTLKQSHTELVKNTTKEQKGLLPYFVHEDYYSHEELYFGVKADLRDMLTDSSMPMQQSENINSSCVQLPKMHLPTFSGHYDEWQTFEDLFVSLVHDNVNISEAQKLHYLKCSVTGEAEMLLKHIKVTHTNYKQAWDILKGRYGNKRLIINSVLKKLFNQKKLTNQSPNHLKKLLDSTTDCLHNLNNLKINTSSWDPIIIYLVVQKLDIDSHREWEESAYKTTEELPTWLELKEFLESKYRTLELVSFPIPTRERTKEHTFHIAKSSLPPPQPSPRSCIKCHDNHTLCHCKIFSVMNTEERRDFVKSSNLCFNCLAPGHSVARCRVPMSCRLCHRRHHSLLHVDSTEINKAQVTPTSVNNCVEQIQNIQVNTTIAATNSTIKQGFALLATAIVPVQNEEGHTIFLRTLIDQGSQASFISERATQMLKLKKHPMRGTIVGVGSTRTDVKHVVQIQIGSRWDTNFSLLIQPYVISKQLTAKIPTQVIINNNWQHLEGLDLADPSYHTPGSIDMLLGVKEYTNIMQQGIIKGPPGTPCAHQTSLGWIIFGEIVTNLEINSFHVMHLQLDIEDMLKSLWEIEYDTRRKMTSEEKRCEDIYEQTHTRNEEGRYIVKLPFKTDNPRSPEGNTKDIAMNRLLQLERKFKRLPKLREEYTKVMEEFIQLEHMEEVPRTEINNRSVYLPHHAIVNPEKESTKTRVVFDASCKDEGIPMMVSLNDELLVGPQLQEDLRNLLMRWRMKKICFIADITQMYRQLLVTKSQADYQRILWRADSSKDVQTYRLLRVTFGTASAPYLAVKTLHQIAKDETPEMENTLDDDIKQNITHTYLPAVRNIKEDFYMDDLISGADEVKQAIDLANTITEILEKGCFTLTKWASNSVDFMKAIKPEKRSIHAQLDLNMDGTMKALGIAWNLKKDEFLYTQNLPPRNLSITKRTILSDIQKIFDPLGWIAPTIISAKMLIQKLWLAKSNWDDEVDPTLKEEWSVLRSDFEGVKDIRIDRWLHTNEKSRIQFHGFSDASMNAYAAAVYIRVENADGSINTKLIASRARVAPVKTISVPRLELCGALLLSKLMRQIGDAMREPTVNMFAWTDSLIVIAWLSGEPNKWKPYVANRVVEITEIISSDRWFHVQSQDNPADIASRGMLLRDLKECELWWRGPKWLFKNKLYISKPDILSTTLELKEKYIQTNVHITGKETKESREDNTKINFDNFTTLTDLLKTICYCRRLLTYCKIKDNETGPSALTTAEFEHALKVCIKIAQKEEFEIDIENLKKKKTLDKRSKLKRLNPYLDEDGMLRVGGRLRHADLQDYHKHPIILGDKSILTLQIVANAHKKTLHGGLQLMLAYLQSKFWIIKAKILVKSHIYRCLICARYNAVPRTQLMGDLPKERVTPTRPFLHSGVDFAGPISVLMSRGRGAKVTKAYISIFICLSTKAIHLELVGDLTSQSFIAAFKRFVSRRGKCIHLWSDQGRNFVGANKELTQAWQAANFEFDKVTNLLTLDGTQWHFIPAYSPNFGGLWEAGVKSIKYHLKRILTTNLIFEEMSTVLCEIEAVLNSRPISAMDDDITPLTPGHFLIGEVPIVVPGPSLENIKVHNLARWQHTQKLLGDFWRRWQNEYLTRLQQRPKWLKEKKDFEKGDIVLIKMDGLPPGKWSLGRIVDKHPGADNLTRVYSVKSGEHITKRSVTKLCAMPIDTSTTE